MKVTLQELLVSESLDVTTYFEPQGVRAKATFKDLCLQHQGLLLKIYRIGRKLFVFDKMGCPLFAYDMNHQIVFESTDPTRSKAPKESATMKFADCNIKRNPGNFERKPDAANFLDSTLTSLLDADGDYVYVWTNFAKGEKLVICDSWRRLVGVYTKKGNFYRAAPDDEKKEVSNWLTGLVTT